MINLSDINIGVNVDTAEAERKLKSLPEGIKRQWAEVNKFMSAGPTLQGAAGSGWCGKGLGEA